MTFPTDGIVGANVGLVYPGTTTNGENAPFPLGTKCRGVDGIEYVLVQAAEAIATTTKRPYCLTVDENYQASRITHTSAIAGHRVAFAPELVIADNDFFWAKTSGVFNVRVAAACAADITLWTTAAAGRLDDTSGGTSGVAIFGVVLVTAASASTSEGNTVREALVTHLLCTTV